MNILIIISFIFIIGSLIILLMPRKTALRISGINRYDLRTVPFRYVVWVFIIASLILAASTVLFIYEVKGILSPVPGFVEFILEWFNI